MLAAILFTVLLAFLEIRHFMTGGDVYRQAPGSPSSRCMCAVWLALAIGLERLRLRTGSVVHDVGALAIAALALAAIVFGLGFDREPALHRRAGRRAVLQPHPARLRHAGAARRRARLW